MFRQHTARISGQCKLSNRLESKSDMGINEGSQVRTLARVRSSEIGKLSIQCLGSQTIFLLDRSSIRR